MLVSTPKADIHHAETLDEAVDVPANTDEMFEMFAPEPAKPSEHLDVQDDSEIAEQAKSYRFDLKH